MKQEEEVRLRALRAERALDELSLSVTTAADRARVEMVRDGLHALDSHQADMKLTIADTFDLLRERFGIMPAVDRKRFQRSLAEAEPTEDLVDVLLHAAEGSK